MSRQDNIISVEKEQHWQAVKEDADQARRSHDQLVGGSENQKEKWKAGRSCSLEDKLKNLTEALNNAQAGTRKPLIQRTPFKLRDSKNFEKYFEPVAVPFGPLHHGKRDKFKLAEELKLILAAHFIRDSGKEKVVLYEMIKNDIETLRKCYEEEAIKEYQDDEELAWVLFVDGCAVLHVIYCVAENKLKDLKILKKDLAAFGLRDLFLLENQLPYRVLELLMSSSDPKHGQKLRDSVEKFIDMNIMAPELDETPKKKQQQQLSEDSQPAHLLELLLTRLLDRQPNDHIINVHKSKKPHNWPTFRNIMELKTAGILLKPSKTSSLADISFNSRCCIGTLRLPPIIVDDSTASKFLNLVAYEMCPDVFNDFGVTSYVCFLDSLIDQAEDVRELRAAGILYNLLGSDQDVATLFNEISTDLVPNPDAYSKVKEGIQIHCNHKWTTWIAQGYHDHFSSPWTFLAFTAAIIGLALSFIQTWYAMHG